MPQTASVQSSHWHKSVRNNGPKEAPETPGRGYHWKFKSKLPKPDEKEYRKVTTTN